MREEYDFSASVYPRGFWLLQRIFEFMFQVIECREQTIGDFSRLTGEMDAYVELWRLLEFRKCER